MMSLTDYTVTKRDGSEVVYEDVCICWDVADLKTAWDHQADGVVIPKPLSTKLRTERWMGAIKKALSHDFHDSGMATLAVLLKDEEMLDDLRAEHTAASIARTVTAANQKVELENNTVLHYGLRW